MKLAVIGTGYVGLVTGAGFAELGHEVTCVDIDHARIATLHAGGIPIHEPGLEPIVRRNRELGRLQFSTSMTDAVATARVVFIAVGTPSARDGSADTSAVLAVAKDIALAIRDYTVVVTKSTVPVGTGPRIEKVLAEHATVPWAIASNPEFLKEGDAVNDFMRPSRVVIGSNDPRAIETLRELYRGVMRTSDRFLVMSLASAELTKYAANAMLATRISFMNELARLAETVGADIESVRQGVGSDPRIGSKFLFAGCGFGGSCFPKDLRALIHTAREHDVSLTIVEAAERANERQQRALGRRVIHHFGGNLDGRKIGVWGLSFKPETDDTRESPALPLIEQLLAANANVTVYDPIARAPQVGGARFVDDAYLAAEGADALVLVTEWHELRTPDLDRLAETMRTPILFDGRNVWPVAEARRAGFVYQGIGRV